MLRKPVADTLADDPGERGGRLLVPLAGPGRSCGRLDPKGVAAKARPRPDRDTFPDDPGRAGVRRPEGTAIDLTKDKPAFPGRPRGKSPGNGPRDAFGLFPGGPVRDPATVKAFNPPGGE